MTRIRGNKANRNERGTHWPIEISPNVCTRDRQAHALLKRAVAIAESMEEQNWGKTGGLRGWRSAFVGVVAIVCAVDDFDWAGGFTDSNDGSGAMPCSSQRHRLGHHGRVNSERARLRG